MSDFLYLLIDYIIVASGAFKLCNPGRKRFSHIVSVPICFPLLNRCLIGLHSIMCLVKQWVDIFSTSFNLSFLRFFYILFYYLGFLCLVPCKLQSFQQVSSLLLSDSTYLHSNLLLYFQLLSQTSRLYQFI